MKINCIVIDDEPLARRGVVKFIEDVPFLHLVGVYANPTEAVTILSSAQIDLMFLDIQMPKINGLDFLKSLKNQPLTVIISAYHNFAAESYELDVIDYILKPFMFDRFLRAANKVKDYVELKSNSLNGALKNDDYFFVKCESSFKRIFYQDLLFVQAMQNYVIIRTVNKQYVCYLSLSAVEEYLPSDKFIKVQKSYIVSTSKIDSVESDSIQIGELKINISRQNKDEIISKILGKKLIKRNQREQ